MTSIRTASSSSAAPPAATRATTRGWLLALALCGALVVLSVALVDRSVARYIDSQFRGTDVETLGLGVLLLLKPILAASLVLLVVGGILKSIRRDVPAWMHGPLVTALSMAITLAVALSLKVAVGRSQVYPTFIPDHLYTLRPFHGGGDYEAFPSATLAVSAAGLTVVWLRVSRLRSLCVTALLLVEAAILLTNGHWLSDTLAGTFLGGFVGWAVCVRAVAWTRPR